MPFPNPETQFAPGRSGNPGGRPRGRTLAARLRAFLEQVELPGRDGARATIPGGRDVADLITETLVREALGGNIKALMLLYERHDGKATGGADAPDDAPRPRLVIPDADA